MHKQQILRLDPETVRVGWRARTDLGDVNGLSGSIAELGQISPVVVRRDGDGYELIAGLRRLTACKGLHCDVLAVEVEPQTELVTLDIQLAENARRKEFDMLELGLGLAKRKEIYEREYPQSRPGGARSGAGRPRKDGETRSHSVTPDCEQDGSVARFSKMMALKLGIAETTVKNCLQIAGLSPDGRDAICKESSSAGRNKAAKKALGELRRERKRKRLEAAAAAREQPGQESRVTLHHLDNRDFFRACKEVKFDVVLTDPPYESGRKSLISHASRKDIDANFGDWDQLDVGWVAAAAQVLAKGGHLLAFSPLEAIGDYREVCSAAGLDWHGAVIWHRTNPGTVHRSVYLSACEAIVWATRPGASYHFEPWENAGDREAHNLIEGAICGGNERLSHPTQKPEWLIEKLLRRHAHDFSTVLDPFAGVGTTLVVCQRLGIQCVGIEKDDDYARQARLRLAAVGGGE